MCLPLSAFAASVLLTACTAPQVVPDVPSSAATSSVSVVESSSVQSSLASLREIPLPNALPRVTKKFFGTKVSPADSPVSPERFSGYHTGVDFETTEAEQKSDVPVSAICSGKVRVSKYVSGYGGVLIQDCAIDDRAVTVLYGHLRLSSIALKAGDTLRPGDHIGVLGTGYSSETDGERRHLHLSIHRGTAIEYRGYVQAQAELSAWMDPLAVLEDESSKSANASK